MPQSFGYILNQRPFRDASFLVDIFTEDYGRICCVARPAKKRGKLIKGNLEPFRYNHLHWIGKGDVQTLTEADERGRHTIPPSELMLGIYLNELLLLLTRPHVAMSELFSAYKYTLHKLGDVQINRQMMIRFELYLLSVLGYPLERQTDQKIQPKMHYLLSRNEGLVEQAESAEDRLSLLNNEPITGELLLALKDLSLMSELQWQQTRTFLDATFYSLSPRRIHSRQLLKL